MTTTTRAASGAALLLSLLALAHFEGPCSAALPHDSFSGLLQVVYDGCSCPATLQHCILKAAHQSCAGKRVCKVALADSVLRTQTMCLWTHLLRSTPCCASLAWLTMALQLLWPTASAVRRNCSIHSRSRLRCSHRAELLHCSVCLHLARYPSPQAVQASVHS